MCMGHRNVEFAGVEDGQEDMNDDLKSLHLTKIMVKKEVKLLLIQSVRQHDAHISPCRKTEEDFSKIRDRVVFDLPEKSFMKTIRDKLQSMVAERQLMNRFDLNSSGTAEETGPCDQLLYGFITKIEGIQRSSATIARRLLQEENSWCR